MTPVDGNKALVRRFVDEIWNRGDAPLTVEFLAGDVAVHLPPFPDATGVDALKGVAAAFRTALPDLVVEADVVAGEGDRVIHRFSLNGTHTGAALFGADASHRAISTSGVTMFLISDGRIAAVSGLFDIAGLMQQLHPTGGTER